MSITEAEKQHVWIERLKSGGAIPHCEPEKCVNGWASPPGNNFMVRGPDYFKNKLKIPGGEYLLQPVGFDWVKCCTKTRDMMKHPNSRVRLAMEDEFAASPEPHPLIWAFNLQVPGKDNYSAVAYFVDKEPVKEGSLTHRFIQGDDSFRNSRLKLIANIVKGPWIVKKAVGEQAICIIGRAISCRFCVENNFVEVDMDIGSSMVAAAIVHLAFGYIRTITVDIAFVIEGQVFLELPERILGAVRLSELDPASAQLIEPFVTDFCINSSLPTRFWRSIGHGFSNIIQPDGCEFVPVCGNGKLEENGKVDEK